MAARRGAPASGAFQSSGVSLAKNGLSAMRIAGLPLPTWMVGGMVRWRSASSSFASPAMPAAVVAWPMFDFTEPSAQKPVRPV